MLVYLTHPLLADTDTLSDADELAANLDANNLDTNADGVDDGEKGELDTDEINDVPST